MHKNIVKKFGKVLLAVAMPLALATSAFAIQDNMLQGDYSVQLDGQRQHGVGFMSFDGAGNVTGTWVTHALGAQACTYPVSGTETAGSFGTADELDLTVGASPCYNKKLQVKAVVVPFNHSLGFNMIVTTPTSAIQSGVGNTVEPTN